MKKIISVLTALILAFSVIPAQMLTASATIYYREGKFTFYVENGKAVITECKADENTDTENIVIPASLKGYPVDNFNLSVFYYYKNNVRIMLSEGINYINTGLYSPHDLLKIKSIFFPSTIKERYDSEYLQYIENLEEIHVADDNTDFCDIDGILYTKETNSTLSLICYPRGKKDQYFIMPDNVVGGYYITNNNLKYLEINKANSAGNRHFWGDNLECLNFTEDKLGEEVKFSSYSFYGCDNLKYINGLAGSVYSDGNGNLSAKALERFRSGSNATVIEDKAAVTERKLPTCNEGGSISIKSAGRTVYSLQLPASQHSFSEYVPDNNATSVTDGTITAVCKKCGYNETVTNEYTRTVIDFLPSGRDALPIVFEKETEQMIDSSIETIEENAALKALMQKKRQMNPDTVFEKKAIISKHDSENQADAKIINSFAETAEKNVGTLFDIGICVSADGSPIGTLSETDNPLQFAFALPKELKNPGRKFTVVRVHNGIATELKTTEINNALYFETDKFSTFAIVYYDIERPKFAGASLTILNSLTIKFKIDIAEFKSLGYSDPYVEFVFNGNTKISRYYYEENGYYVFRFYDVTPDKINSTISLTAYANYGDEIVHGDTVEYSIADYCYNMLEKYSDDSYADLRTLLVDLLHYGAKTQLFVNFNTGNLADTRLTEIQSSWGTNTDPVLRNALSRPVDESMFSVKWKGAGLCLSKNVEMRFMIETEDISGLTIHISDGAYGEYNIPPSTFEPLGNNMYYVYFQNLYATQMSYHVYARAMRDGVPVSGTLVYSIESYAFARQNDTENPALADLVKAMMKYGNSALRYSE